MEPDENSQGEHPKTFFAKVKEFIFGDSEEIADIDIHHDTVESEETDLADSDEVKKEYRRLLRKVWEDRHLSVAEFEFLQEIASSQRVSRSLHEELEAEVLAELKEEPQECPHCGAIQVYDDEDEVWHCEVCGADQYLDRQECPECGALQEYDEGADKWYCESCEGE